MGNGSSSNRRRHHHRHHQPSQPLPPPPPPPPSNPEMTGNRYVFAAATPYPSHYPTPNPNPNPNPNYYQYSGYYPPPPPQPPSVLVPPPTSFDHQRGVVGPNVDPGHVNWVGGRFPCLVPHVPPPYVEHQKAVTIRNDVNLKKETLKMEPDEDNPGFFLTTFIFDATVAGRITLIFFAKEGEDCNLAPVKDGMLQPISVSFQQGLGQRFKQPSGTGIDFSKFEEAELLKKGTTEIYPLVVKAEGFTSDHNQSEGGNSTTENGTSQITQAVFGKENGEYQVRVVKQILWVNGMRYELQEIYGIGNSSDTDFDGNDPGKECVICLSEPRDTTVLPCRHMCMCSECAKVLRFQTDRCPICRQPVERLLEIKVNDRQEE